MTNGQAGKGSRYRPVNKEKWDKNWTQAFGQTKPGKKKKSPGVIEPGGIIDMSNVKESENNNE